ncbi:DUF1499 domain-containing protein [Rhodobacteraceae bacterium B1Z28]|uniref:DUF1499 domain-containing protein n=1 Tax=Ruegeria haliotis TaxID=2747601 RepID=A0ABX2PMZ0_9RHOB|nr:DUF1499 domain-containing protein [Ruegeria haliotis]NVO55500.1 DUF1499 domain-containing protein [Ruegeria haliotis]
MKKMGLWLVVGAVVLMGAYIRLAPSDPGRWHVAPVGDVDRNDRGGVLRLVETGPDGLERLDAIARTSPRTRVLTGSVEEGVITYVTRTPVIGFPDYTTVQQDGDTLRIHGRLRFGRSDFGVNRGRVDGWLALLQP